MCKAGEWLFYSGAGQILIGSVIFICGAIVISIACLLIKNGDIARVSSSEKLYRIRQFNGGYWIEKKLNTSKGFLWWKKPSVEWRPIDVNGRCCIYSNFGHGNVIDTYRIKMPPFGTLEDAKSQIEKLEFGTVFHYC